MERTAGQGDGEGGRGEPYSPLSFPFSSHWCCSSLGPGHFLPGTLVPISQLVTNAPTVSPPSDQVPPVDLDLSKPRSNFLLKKLYWLPLADKTQ